MDGATREPDVLAMITVPQIPPTIVVVVTTLIVTVMKVFDIGQGHDERQLRHRRAGQPDVRGPSGTATHGSGAPWRVILFISVIPIMVINIRRMQRGPEGKR